MRVRPAGVALGIVVAEVLPQQIAVAAGDRAPTRPAPTTRTVG
jgi:hypothetical protein